MSELDQFFSNINQALDETLDRIVPAKDAEPQNLNSAIRWSLFGAGKRFRPALLIAVGRTFGSDDDRLLSTAAAVEMIHTYSLIHDDLPAMDDDDLRRGRATCHKRWGEATAILAGDALQVLAFSAIADDDRLPPDVRLILVSELARASAQMVAGQQLDLEAEGKQVSADDVENIHKNKTGALISFSANAGALLGGASVSERRVIAEFSETLGLLFQISDDILDVTQSTKTLGKTAAKDITSHKATYPSIYGIEEARRLEAAVRDEALELLNGMGRPAKMLREITDFIVQRES